MRNTYKDQRGENRGYDPFYMDGAGEDYKRDEMS